jgi:hypothetical protein
MVICPSCGSENPDDAKFCNSCSTPLTAAAAPEIGSEVPPDTYTIQEIVPDPTPVESAPPASEPPPVYVHPRPLKDRSVALILEILPAFFGFLGFGWIYAGNTQAGIIWLIAFLLWTGTAIVISVLTLGIGIFCCWLPISIACIAVSAVNLSNYTKAHPELFGE